MTSGGAARGMLHFSVDRASVGISISRVLGLDVFTEAAAFQQAGDIYVAPGAFGNSPIHALIYPI